MAPYRPPPQKRPGLLSSLASGNKVVAASTRRAFCAASTVSREQIRIDGTLFDAQPLAPCHLCPPAELYFALGHSIYLASKRGEASCCAGLRSLRASSWRLPQFRPKGWPGAEEVASVEGVASTEAEEWAVSTEAEGWVVSTEAEEWVAFMRAA